MKANIPEVEALVNTDRSLVCDGKKGLLTRLLTVMKREPPDSSFRSASRRPKIKTPEIKLMICQPSLKESPYWSIRLSVFFFVFFKDFSRFVSSSAFYSFAEAFCCVCRFWQARAVESFLRGATSYADQMFLLKRGLLEVKLQPWIVFLIIHEDPPHSTDLSLILNSLECTAAHFLFPSLDSTSCFAS